jgi:hypothetical protein
MTEFVGASNSGKTQVFLLFKAVINFLFYMFQLCLSLVSRVVCEYELFQVAYIDTCAGFSAQRVLEIMEGKSSLLNEEQRIMNLRFLSKIQRYSALSVNHFVL